VTTDTHETHTDADKPTDGKEADMEEAEMEPVLEEIPKHVGPGTAKT